MHSSLWNPLVVADFGHYNETERNKVLKSQSSSYDFWYRLYLNLDSQTVMKLPIPSFGGMFISRFVVMASLILSEAFVPNQKDYRRWQQKMRQIKLCYSRCTKSFC
jgi:hypothetical protein